MAGTVIDLETDDFTVASSAAKTTAAAVRTARNTARSSMSSLSQMAGSDPAGVQWSAEYDTAASQAMAGLDGLVSGLEMVAAGLSITGINYATADWNSAGHDGMAPGSSVPTLPIAECTAPPPSASGGARTSPIPGFEWVENFIGTMWPDGDTDKLESAGSAWSALADSLDQAAGSDAARIRDVLAGNQTPELPTIFDTVNRVKTQITDTATNCRALGKACTKFAAQIDHVHKQTEQELQNLLLQIEATAAVSIGLTIVTAGISDAAGAAAVTAEVGFSVARILAWIAQLGRDVLVVVDEIGTAAGAFTKAIGIGEKVGVRVVAVTSKSVNYGLQGAGVNVAVQSIANPGSDLTGAARDGFIGGMAFGLVGEAAVVAGTRAGNMAFLKQGVKEWSAAKGGAGYNPFGTMTERQWYKTYLKGFDDKGRPNWQWPAGKNGFLDGASVANQLKTGDEITRLSAVGKDGRFATNPGTHFGEMSLPPDRLAPNFVTTKYKVLKPLPSFVREGKIDPGFEQPGMGKQYFFPKGIDALVKAGYLKVIP